MGNESSQAPHPRSQIRIKLRGNIKAKVSIVSVFGEGFQSSYTPVLLDDLSPTGFKCHSHLRFPVNSDYVLHIETSICQWELSLLGHVVWRRKEDNLYAYGIEFIPDDHIQKAIRIALLAYIGQMQPNYRRIHQLYERMMGGANAVIRSMKFDQKG